MVSKILGPDGQPIRLQQLAGEPQTARLSALRSEYSDHPTRGLTPAGLARLYAEAEQGQMTAQAELAEDMQEKDAHLYAELAKRQQALLTLDWDLVPSSTATAAERAEVAKIEAILRDEMDLDELILSLAGGILPGYAAVELDWQRSEGQWRVTPIERPATWFTVHPDERNTLRLRDGSTYGDPLRPWGWIAHYHPAKNGYLARSGLVRVLGWPFLFRNLTARDLAEFLEIYGLPLRLGRYPVGASDDEKSTLMQAVVNIGHAAAGILPEGMAIEFQQAADGASDPFMAMIGWAERSMSKAILGGTLSSEVGSSGSYAAAKVHDEVRQDILRADMRLIARSLTRDLITPLTRLNSRLRAVPSFRFDLGETDDLGRVSEAVPKLVEAGARIPERWLHERLRIPVPEGNEPILSRPDAAQAVPLTQQRPGCQCEGCRVVALRSQPGEEPQDQLDALDYPDLHDQAQALIRPLLDALRDGLSPEQALDTVAQANPQLGDDLLTEALARAMFAVELAGRLEVQNE